MAPTGGRPATVFLAGATGHIGRNALTALRAERSDLRVLALARGGKTFIADTCASYYGADTHNAKAPTLLLPYCRYI